jgi:hypothetical protein
VAVDALAPDPPADRAAGDLHHLLRTGAGAVLVVAIMSIGSLVLWIGTPLLWLWVAAQIQGSTESLQTALGAAFLGVVASIAALAIVLAWLSSIYRANRVARGLPDTGHAMLEGVLVVSAGIAIVAFSIWFLLFAGAAPAPIGIQL